MASGPATDAVKLSVSGAALGALLACCGSADGNCDGLLFGRVARPPPSFYDDDGDDQARASSGPSLSISITGHVSVVQPSSLADPLSRFRSFFPDPSAAIGFFSSRRRTPLRPSMGEAALARSLSQTLVAGGLGKDERLQGSSGQQLSTVWCHGGGGEGKRSET
ncbi:hypothetical protein E2562_001718 [Oryza meyeriana var. granulata]|uniref:Uncharacterized protein n=1 Tax=Oryza meyeriana var. granulata TaxID=110450 RepID=A0A6G1CEJ9_9ORYZ|nr:hypothetical protein E2562_001718 [Oryza meyeriana var. granulata]